MSRANFGKMSKKDIVSKIVIVVLLLSAVIIGLTVAWLIIGHHHF